MIYVLFAPVFLGGYLLGYYLGKKIGFDEGKKFKVERRYWR